MPNASSIVIVRPEHLDSVGKCLAETELVQVISESDLLQLQDAIVAQAPHLLVMHSALAATSRGASLVAALKAHPSDTPTAIRVFIEDQDQALPIVTDTLPPAEALLAASRPLERAGTRQVARYPMNGRAVAVNGEAGQLINLSVAGAQVQTTSRLRPRKVARLVLPETNGDLKVKGTVAWAIAVQNNGSIQYRAGVEFANPDKKQLTKFCTAHGDAPDPTLGPVER